MVVVGSGFLFYYSFGSFLFLFSFSRGKAPNRRKFKKIAIKLAYVVFFVYLCTRKGFG